MVPPLLSRLQKFSPAATLNVVTAERQQAVDLLDADRIDCALGWFDEKPGHCGVELMMEENLFCVFRRDHPIVRRGSRFDIAAVLSYPHVVVSAGGQGIAIFDELLKRHGLARRALVAVTNFTAVPSLLGGTDMIGVFTKLAADVFQKSFGMTKRPVPLDVGKIATRCCGRSLRPRPAALVATAADQGRLSRILDRRYACTRARKSSVRARAVFAASAT